MRVSLVLSALLCFTTWMSMGHATHGPMSDCCIGWSNTKVQLDRIANYTVQSESICPIKAIIFHTKLGKILCSDPSSSWAKRAIKKVDEEKKKKGGLQEMGQNEDRTTSEITPAVSATSKKAPQKKGRNGRRRLRKRSRKGKKLLSKRI